MVLSTSSWIDPNSETAMAKYECIRGVVTSKGPVAPGEIVELSDHEAKMLAGKFIAAKDAPAPVAAPAEIRVAEAPDIEHRDPVIEAPKRGRPRGR